MSRSGRINDLNNLVNDARRRSSTNNVGSGGSVGNGGGAGAADDASISSFSRSMARVASDASARSGMIGGASVGGARSVGGGSMASGGIGGGSMGGGRSVGGRSTSGSSMAGSSLGGSLAGSRRPPPLHHQQGQQSTNPHPYANMGMAGDDSVISGASGVSEDTGRTGHTGHTGHTGRTGQSGNNISSAQSISDRSNTTARLMSLVQELSSKGSHSPGSEMSSHNNMSTNGSNMGSRTSNNSNDPPSSQASRASSHPSHAPPSRPSPSHGPMNRKSSSGSRGSHGSHGSRGSRSSGSGGSNSRANNPNSRMSGPNHSQSHNNSTQSRSFNGNENFYHHHQEDMMSRHSGSIMNNPGLHPEVYIQNTDGDDRSIDAESLSLASGFTRMNMSSSNMGMSNNNMMGGSQMGSHMGGSNMGGMPGGGVGSMQGSMRSGLPPPPPSSGASMASSQGGGGYAVPYLNNNNISPNGTRVGGGDPSVAGSRSTYSKTSSYASGSQYSQSTGMSSSHASGHQDPGGYIMPRGLGVLPTGSVYSQSTYHSNNSNNMDSMSQNQSAAGSSAMLGSNPSIIGGSLMNDSHPSSVFSQSQTNSQFSGSESESRYSGGTLESNYTGRPSVPGSSASAPGGSHGSHSHNGDVSVMSRSYMSQPLPHNAFAGEDSFAGNEQFQNNNAMPMNDFGTASLPNPSVGSAADAYVEPNFAQVVPHYGGDDYSSFVSKNSRSIAGSAAMIPRAKFSWANESLGPQSTVATRRSIQSNNVPEANTQRESKAVEGRLWSSFAWIITFPIPNKCVMRPTKDAKQAWREKVALFLIMASCSIFFVGVFGFVPLLLCKEDIIFSMQDIWLQTGENWVVVHGTIYDVKDLVYRHPGGVKGIVDYLGKDATKVFPRSPPVTLPQKCLDMEKVEAYQLNVYAPDNNFTNPTCASFTELDILLGVTCHTFAAGSNGTAKFLGDYERGMLSHTTVGLNSEGIRWIGIYDRVYDVTTYVDGINKNEATIDGEETNLRNNPGAYLTPTLNKVIMNSLNADATELYEALFGSTEYIACLEELFYIGLLDDELDTFCHILNVMMYVMLISVATLMVIQFLASMVYICPRHRTYSEEDVMSPVMVMVPCYNEGDNELRKTIKSVLNTTYPDENKVLFMVGDGLVTGNGEDMSTPEHLANILGFDIDEFEDDTFEYDCIGVTHTKNRARVYHGILQKGPKFLKYISVIKCGLPAEAISSAKPGNRGKRDSQLITMGYYNRIHYGRELTELDSAVQRAMVDLNLQADMVRFLMAIDADTRVDTMSITHMVYGMDKKERVLALCGETKVDNKASSWVTMIQVFEYYNAHHLKKAFEAAFGCVTCLPGCFTMYRIIADDGTPLLPADGVLYDYSRNDVETLHEKNLYHLGEDRMLTTLLLKHFPDRSLTFIPEAACWTIVPHTFKILLSQRRRWINSTVHNMFELLRVNTMCGVCCVSMKVVVFIDLIATMILPASYCYAMYLIFLVFFEDLPVSTILLILYAIIMGVQVVVFIIRSRWDYCWWFFVYFTIGLPVFYVILPVYSFWNMDDFSWGKTRSVGGSAAANADSGNGSVAGADNVGGDDGSFEKDIDDRSTTSSSSEYSASEDGSEDESRSGSEDGSEDGSRSGSEYASDEESEDGSQSRSRSGSEYSDDDDEGSEHSDRSGSNDDRSDSRYGGSRRSAPNY